jgi:hypothetical protein
MAGGAAAGGRSVRRRLFHARRYVVHRLPVVGRSDRQGRHRHQLAEAATKRGKRWIWIHHAPPAKSPTSWGGDRYFGDVELLEWIEQYRPDMVLSGHVHQSPFVKDGSWVDRIGPTWVFNTGQQFGAPPAHIIIDTDADEALWFSSAGNQVVRLDAPLERPVPKLQALPDWLKAADRLRAQAPG